MPAQTLMYKCNWARYIYKAMCASFETGKTIPNMVSLLWTQVKLKTV